MPFGAILSVCVTLDVVPEASMAALDAMRGFLAIRLGGFYLAFGLGMFILSLWLSFSKIGGIRLGMPEEKPVYSFWVWGAMVFTCGLAADILFYALVLYGKLQGTMSLYIQSK